MTLKEELEILRGEPIQVFTGDPMDIPCVETSDSERLCKHPVVSVHMITYNHEPYIRQAIEGVMMQKTDFEFELVIGEDCSSDKTREICFEYQRKYPDKIRILWCDHNLYRNPHPAGGNSRRNMVHCRGEFIALCEGDDYWTDPLKLQKQVEVMRKCPNVGLCFCGARELEQKTGRNWSWDSAKSLPIEAVSGLDFVKWHIFGKDPRRPGPETFIMTHTVMFRKIAYEKATEQYDIFNWKLRLGDTTTWLGVASVSDAYYLPDEVGVYRLTSTGACATSNGGVWFDAFLVRIYFGLKCGCPELKRWIGSRRCDPLRVMLFERLVSEERGIAREHFALVRRSFKGYGLFSAIRTWPMVWISILYGFRPIGLKRICQLYNHLPI